MSASTYTIADIHAHLLSQFPQAQLQVIDESAGLMYGQAPLTAADTVAYQLRSTAGW